MTLAKVLCKPHFEKPHLVTGRSEMGKSKSARIGPYSKFHKPIHDGSVSWSWQIMNMLMKFGIGSYTSTFGLPRYNTPLFNGVYSNGV